jgi:hypothetical protein
MEPSSGDPIREYILANRDKYTKEAIRDQLLAAGHDQTAIDHAWQAVGADASSTPEPPSRAGIVTYVLVWYVLGALITLPIALSVGFGVFLLLYVIVGGVLAYLVSRIHVTGAGWFLAVPLVPIAFFLVAFGTCLAAYSTGG